MSLPTRRVQGLDAASAFGEEEARRQQGNHLPAPAHVHTQRSECAAQKLAAHFHTLTALQRALNELDTFAMVRLDTKRCVRKARLQTLRKNYATSIIASNRFGAQDRGC